MVTLVKKTINRKVVYYLRHNIRVKGKHKTVERYLGDRLPKDLEYVMLDFFRRIHRKGYEHVEKTKKKWTTAERRIPESVIKKNLKEFGIRFTYNTNRIEGSTLSIKDTFSVIERGMTPDNKPIEDIKEAENHFKVFNEMLELKNLNLSLVLKWHYGIFKDTKKDVAGKVRDYQVKISGSKFMPPSPVEINPMLKEFFRWLDKNWDRYDAVDLAGLAHLKFVTIHPFGDGNGRISRLIMNWILWRKDYPMFIIEYRNRVRYYTSLERAQVKKNQFIFLGWFTKNYIRFIEKEFK
ncbi:MAG: Fic family protein [Candidatus Micrarchaeota archaeon]